MREVLMVDGELCGFVGVVGFDGCDDFVMLCVG